MLSSVSGTSAQAIQRVLATPPAPRERDALGASASIGDAAREFRTQLGLPADRAIVLSGHQCELWHPGILAKWFAGGELAKASGAAFAWLLVDTDDNDPLTLRVPVAGPREARVTIASDSPAGTPTGFRPPAPAPALRSVVLPAGLPPSAGLGLARALTALAAREGEASLGWQVGRATRDVLAGLSPAPTLIGAGAVSRTRLFERVLDSITADPQACAASYNAAAARQPGAGIRALRMTRDRVELPLWRVRAGAARAAVDSLSLRSTPREELAPRALLLTGLLRLAGCELFVHGLGGGVYDRVTGAWLDDWLRGSLREELGREGDALAPAWVVSATVYLPGLADSDAPTPAQAAREAWRAHAAAHTPALLGDMQSQHRKAELVRTIAEARGNRAQRGRLYAELHELLARTRASHEGTLREQAARALEAQRRVRDGALAWDRTWPFVLYPAGVLAALRERVVEAVRTTGEFTA